MQRNASFIVAGQQLDYCFPQAEEEPKPEALMEEVLTRLGRFTLFRRLATTSKGYVTTVTHCAE